MPPDEAHSIRDLAKWMRRYNVDAQSDEAVSVLLKNGSSFKGFFIERCSEEYLLITHYLDDGDLTIPDEEAPRGFVALNWDAIAALSWTTSRVPVRSHPAAS